MKSDILVCTLYVLFRGSSQSLRLTVLDSTSAPMARASGEATACGWVD